MEATIIENERHDTLRNGLIELLINLKPSNTGPKSIVRVDPAAGFQALAEDHYLSQHGIAIEIGRRKNVNKNPRAERAIQEVESEIARGDYSGALSRVTLAIIINQVNSMLRHGGLSAKEMWTHHDQFTHEQLPFDETNMNTVKQNARLDSHTPNAINKANAPRRDPEGIHTGDLVYLIADIKTTLHRHFC